MTWPRIAIIITFIFSRFISITITAKKTLLPITITSYYPHLCFMYVYSDYKITLKYSVICKLWAIMK